VPVVVAAEIFLRLVVPLVVQVEVVLVQELLPAQGLAQLTREVVEVER
jgi:hypothetical protein